MRILIIDDSDSICKMIEALFSASEHHVVAAASGARGLEEAFEATPDVVLLDLNLAGAYDGYEVTRRLRVHATTRSVPVLVIGEHSDGEEKRMALEAGANAYFTKPFSPMSLLKEIDTARGGSGSFLRARRTPP